MRQDRSLEIKQTRLSRRRFLLTTLASGAAIPLAACAPSAPSAPTAAPTKPTEAPKPAAPAPTTAPAAPAAKPAAAPSGTKPSIPTIPAATVRFGNGPFLDHSEAVIGMQKGWFKELNIEVQPPPYGSVVPSEQRAAVLSAGTADVISGGDYAVVPMLKQLPNVRAFTAKDHFLGFALVAQPDSPHKTYADFLKEGSSKEDAIKKAAAQLQGQNWAYQGTAFTKQFVDIVLQRAGLAESDVTLIPVEDPKIVNLMLSKQADFSTTGAPARVELQTKGFKLVLPFDPLFESAKPSPDSAELRAMLYAGWVTTKDFAEKDHDLILRLFGLQYRITKLIREQPEEALAVHVPYLNSIAGRSISKEEGMLIYEEIDPFFTFEDLDRVVNDESAVLYYGHQLEAKIRGYVKDGLYQEGQIKPDDVTLLPTIYKEMVELKKKAEADLKEAEPALNAAKAAGKDVGEAMTALSQAQTHLSNINYLDASRFAQAAKEWAAYLR
jgi:ABC-type nitrate/sulfonate/bicarbonate transport system substrate-binding protein